MNDWSDKDQIIQKLERELAEARQKLVAIKQGLAANNISEKQISNDTPLDSPNIDRYEKNIGATLAMLASRDISLAGAAKNVQEELEKIKHEAQAGARRLARDYEYQRNEHIDICNEAISERDTIKQQFADLEKQVKQNQLQDEEILKLRTQNERLREFVRHKPSCVGGDSLERCNCGLKEALP